MKNKIDEILKNTLRIGEKVLWESVARQDF